MTTGRELLNDRPKAILACICSDFQQVADGGFNLIRIYDSVVVPRPSNLPQGAPVPVLLKAVTCWTEGIGAHTHQLRLLNDDGHPVIEAPVVNFHLNDFYFRHWVLDQVLIPVTRSMRYTVEVCLDGDQSNRLRYVFTVTVP